MLQTRLTADGECVNEYAFGGTAVEVYFFGFVIFTYITTYLIPVIFMAGLYFLVINQLNKRLKVSNKQYINMTIRLIMPVYVDNVLIYNCIYNIL